MYGIDSRALLCNLHKTQLGLLALELGGFHYAVRRLSHRAGKSCHPQFPPLAPHLLGSEWVETFRQGVFAERNDKALAALF